MTHPTPGQRRLLLGVLQLSALLLVAGCAGFRSTPQPVSSIDRPLTPKAWVRTELYFGGIADAPWAEFLASAVTPRFPAGLTILDAKGQWRGKDGTVHQLPTHILVILHPGTAETDHSLEAIRSEFRARFHHESVLRADSPARVTF